MLCMERLNSDFVEKIILKGMLSDKDFLILTSSVFEPEYFDDPNVAHIFKFCKEYGGEYNSIPSRDAIVNSTDTPDEIREILTQSLKERSLPYEVHADPQMLATNNNQNPKMIITWRSEEEEALTDFPHAINIMKLL